MTLNACPVCEAEMRLVRRRTDFTVGKRTATVESEAYQCVECGEVVFTPAQLDVAHRAATTEMRRQRGFLPPNAIRAFRLGRGLTQAQYEQLLGSGPKTVVRWERGTVCQSRSADLLMRLLDAVPGVYEYLATANGLEVPQDFKTQGASAEVIRFKARPSEIDPGVDGGFAEGTKQRTRLSPTREVQLPHIKKERLK